MRSTLPSNRRQAKTASPASLPASDAARAFCPAAERSTGAAHAARAVGGARAKDAMVEATPAVASAAARLRVVCVRNLRLARVNTWIGLRAGDPGDCARTGATATRV